MNVRKTGKSGLRRVLEAVSIAAILFWVLLLATGILSAQGDGDRPDGSEAVVASAAAAETETDAPSVAPSPSERPNPPPALNLKEMKKKGSDGDFLSRLVSLLGLAVMLGLALALSEKRGGVAWKTVAWGVGLQLVFALMILKTAPGQWVFQQLTDVVNVILGFTEEGSRFIFGNLVKNNVPVGTPLGDPAMGPIPESGITAYAGTGAFFAFNVLPVIIFFSSLMSVLYHLRVMQLLVGGAAWVMQRTLKTSGAESLSAAANIFVGMTEAPLVIRPYVDRMTRSELMAVMTGGFATIAGSVLAAYVGMLRGSFPDIAGHLIAASVMSAPAALVIAKILLPETETSLTAGSVKMKVERTAANVIDAAAQGAGDGLKLALNIAAMLLAFISLIAMINYGIGWLGGLVGLEGLTFQQILGYLFWPLAWVMGIPAADCLVAGQLLAEKTVVNEFVAYLHLAQIVQSGQAELSHRSLVILTYALCGFANFGSIAIQLGGIGGIAPSRRADLARLGLRAMFGGLLAAFMTACIAGMIL